MDFYLSQLTSKLRLLCVAVLAILSWLPVHALSDDSTVRNSIAECESTSSDANSFSLKFTFVKKSTDGILATIDQDDKRLRGPTMAYRHLTLQISSDAWKFSNNYDFDLFIYPAEQGKFTGKILGINYTDVNLNCQLTNM